MRISVRYFLFTLVAVLAIAAACGFFVFHVTCDPKAHAAARNGDVMEWMRCEFHLTQAQYAEILRLHETHSERCVLHCAAVQEARERIAAARQADDAAALAKAEAAERDADAVCVAATEAHVRRVAAVMGPEEGARYLALVLPRLSQLDHRGPEGPLLGD